MTARDPIFPNEELQLVTPRQPLIGREFKQSSSIATATALPSAAAIVHDLSIPNPYLSPLHTGIHHVVTVCPIDPF